MNNEEKQPTNELPTLAKNVEPTASAAEVAKALSSVTSPDGVEVVPNADVQALEEDGAEGLHEHILEVDAELGATPLPKVATPALQPVPQPIKTPEPATPIVISPKPVTPPVPPIASQKKAVVPPLQVSTVQPPRTIDASTLGAAAMLKKMPGVVPARPPEPVIKSETVFEPKPILTSPTKQPSPTPAKPVTPISPKQKTPIELDASGIAQQPVQPGQKRLSVLEQLRTLASSPLHPLRTYQSDAEESVKDRGTSLVSILAAEEDRRTRQTAVAPKSMPRPAIAKSNSRNILFAGGAIILLTLSIVAIFYAFFTPSREIAIDGLSGPRLIETEEKIALPITDLDHAQVLRELSILRNTTQLSLGLMREIYFVKKDPLGTETLSTIQEVIPLLAPHMPETMSRALHSSFIVGVHVFDNNQGFIVFKTDDFEQAASAMFEWEPTMSLDLFPFLDRRMRPKLPDEIRPTSTPPRIVKSDFVDAIVENRDSRVLYDNFGDIALLYSFIDRNTVVITNNPKTLLEVVTRYRDTK